MLPKTELSAANELWNGWLRLFSLQPSRVLVVLLTVFIVTINTMGAVVYSGMKSSPDEMFKKQNKIDSLTLQYLDRKYSSLDFQQLLFSPARVLKVRVIFTR